MALNIPANAAEVVNAAKSAVQRELTGSNPFLRNSWLGAIVVGVANRVWDFYYALKQAEKEALPDTAVTTLSRWADLWGVDRAAATIGTGDVIVWGTGVATITTGSDYTSSDGVIYSVTTGASLAVTTPSVTLTGVGNIATATTATPHNLSVGVSIIPSGATDGAYNLPGGVLIASVPTATTFTYLTSAVISTSPDIGTPIVTVRSAVITVGSDDPGAAANLEANAELTITVPISNLNDVGHVAFGGIGGGTDTESDDDLRVRLLEAIRNPVANFNAAAITKEAKKVAGVTRVFVNDAGTTPGTVEVWFMRDVEGGDGIPTTGPGSETETLNTALQLIRPAHMAETDFLVAAPTSGTATPFTFAAISPDTTSMREAIEANLAAFFQTHPVISTNITQDTYRAAILGTVDTTTGERLLSFSLTDPAGDISVGASAIGTLGTITYT
jgi:uncharacterized phage protein gp47/JayE